ncbi:MAG: AAA family ATPase, partial [Hyphomicrobiaceae bacterium]
MAQELREWLERLSLGDLTSLLEENQVDLQDLPLLNDEDLKELGLALGPRRRLLHAAAAMKEGSKSDTQTSSHTQVSSPMAERRHLCVMFADMVGSTELSRRLDPEDLSRVMRRYQEAVSKSVSAYGGHVAKLLGDGVLVFFGWPRAYEDQVERAVRAGLSVTATVSASRNRAGERLAVRVGIATGNVVVGDIIDEDGRGSNEISGETPNLAARLQQLAKPGEVIIDAACARQVGQTFKVTDLGEKNVKGFEAGVRAWLVVGESRQADSRFQAARGTALSPMVGRDTELRLLLDRWELACGGEGQAVFISGEAGIGKSRLAQSLQENISTDDHTPIRYQCSPHHSNSALYPAIRQLEIAARFDSQDPPDTKLDKLEAVLARADASAEDALYFANLLSLPSDARYGPLIASPQQKLEHLLDALLGQLLALAKQKPVLFLFEDAHWIDPTSLTLLERVLAGIQQAQVLIAVTHRPQWRPPIVGVSHVTSLQLNRLGRSHGAAVVRALSGQDIDPDLVERIVARTDGVPLFIEELTKSLLEVGPDTGREEIPETLQASLTERLDRLGPAKELAQIGAVIGRDFPLDLVAAVTDKTEQQLQEAVDELVRSELLFRKGRGAELHMTFKHALVRDTAYETLLISARRDWHHRIAATLEDRFANVLESEPEVIAQHWIEAAETRRAIPLLLRAGRL